MKIIAGILGIVALLALRSAFQDGFQAVVTSAVSDKSATCLALLGSTTSLEDGATYIIGNIKNKCDRKFGDVTITFKLDRPSSGPMAHMSEGIAYAYARDVEPGETRRFKTAVTVSSNATFHFDKITAF
jgi:hypothetical protein